MGTKMYATLGILLFILKTCHADYECYYTDGRTRYCESCCEFDCCEGGDGDGSGLSGGDIAGIVVGSIILLALKCLCICARVRRYQQRTIIRRTVVTVPRAVVVTNTNHAGYDQTRIPTIHQPNPNQRGVSGIQLTNPNPGYDQQVPNFEPIPPPPYERVAKESQK